MTDTRVSSFDPDAFVRRIGPFAFVALAVPMVVLACTQAVDLSWLVASFVAVLGAIGLSVALASTPVPRAAHLIPPLAYLVALWCLRAAAVTGQAVLGVLVVLPVIWAALYYRRWEMMLVLGASAVMLLAGASSRADVGAAAVITLAAFVAGHTVAVLVGALEREGRAIAAIIDHALDAFIEFDESGRILSWNTSAERLFGWKGDALSGRLVEGSIMPLATRAMLASALSGGCDGRLPGTVRSRRLVAPARRCDGGEFLAAWAVTAAGAGDARRYHAFVQDVDDRERAIEGLHASEARFRSAFDVSPIGMLIAGLDGSIEAVNPALCAQLGYDSETLCHLSVRDLTVPEGRDEDTIEVQRLIDGRSGALTVDRQIRRAGGELGWARAHVCVLRRGDGSAMHLLGHIVDVTQRRQTEERRRIVTDLDALTGPLTPGVDSSAQRIATSRSLRDPGRWAP